MLKKYFLITYGCQMNYSDSERIAATLEKEGYKLASNIEESDLIVVNMCSVRQSAVDRIYGKIKDFDKLKSKNLKLKTILTGCILKKDRKKLAKHFDYILDITDLANWQKYLSSNYDDRSKLQKENYFEIEPNYLHFPIAYVPISNGCNNFCAYCVVPYTRGREICRPAKNVIAEVKNLIKKGYKEIWLLGQNVNSYKSQTITFPELLKKINNIPGKFWIRFTSSHPKDFSNKLIEVISKSEKITPYLNLPIQSGDNEILEKMNRKYTVEYYLNLVKGLKKKIPDIALSTDIIVGFPGETKKQFKNTIKLFKKIKFDMAYISQYSPRPMTSALKMKDSVSKEDKKKREKILTKILEKNNQRKNKKHIGQTIIVLATKYKDGFLFGKSFHYKTVKFEGNKNLINEFNQVKITDAHPWGLKGKL